LHVYLAAPLNHCLLDEPIVLLQRVQARLWIVLGQPARLRDVRQPDKAVYGRRCLYSIAGHMPSIPPILGWESKSHSDRVSAGARPPQFRLPAIAAHGY